MFTEITNELRKMNEFKDCKDDADMMTSMANMWAKDSSTRKPHCDPNKFKAPVFEKFLKTLLYKRDLFLENSKKKGSEMLDNLKETFLELRNSDPEVKKYSENVSDQVKVSLQKFFSFSLIFERISSGYVVQNSLGSDGDNKNILKTYEETMKILVKCMHIVLDESGKSVIIDKEDLEENQNLYKKDLCLTEEDFAESSVLMDFYPNIKEYYNIFRKISPASRQIILPQIKEIYGLLVSSLFVSNRYTICFPELPGKHFNFAVFCNGISIYSKLLKPFGFPPSMAMLNIGNKYEFSEN